MRDRPGLRNASGSHWVWLQITLNRRNDSDHSIIPVTNILALCFHKTVEYPAPPGSSTERGCYHREQPQPHTLALSAASRDQMLPGIFSQLILKHCVAHSSTWHLLKKSCKNTHPGCHRSSLPHAQSQQWVSRCLGKGQNRTSLSLWCSCQLPTTSPSQL